MLTLRTGGRVILYSGLPDECHLRAVQPIYGFLGLVGPIWYMIVFALSLVNC